jgi:ketosteroid isomerase-like protein
MSELTEAEMHDIGDRLVAAIAAGDVEGVRSIYASDATIWHNFDQRDQSPDENLLTLVDLHRRASNLQYTEIRRFVAPDGFVQQHVLTGDARGGPLKMPAMIRFWVEGGRITRLEEYLDTRQAMVLYAAD